MTRLPRNPNCRADPGLLDHSRTAKRGGGMNRRSFIGMSALGAIGPTTSKVPQIFPAQRMGSEDALRHYQAVQALGWYSVRDPAFGAKGNNADDDTQAFQAAIDTAPDGSTVYVPPATLERRT